MGGAPNEGYFKVDGVEATPSQLRAVLAGLLPGIVYIAWRGIDEEFLQVFEGVIVDEDDSERDQDQLVRVQGLYMRRFVFEVLSELSADIVDEAVRIADMDRSSVIGPKVLMQGGRDLRIAWERVRPRSILKVKIPGYLWIVYTNLAADKVRVVRAQGVGWLGLFSWWNIRRLERQGYRCTGGVKAKSKGEALAKLATKRR